MSFTTHRKRALTVIQDAPALTPSEIRVSMNSKTGASINLAIVETCNPTDKCKDNCYGQRGPIAFRNSILVQHANVVRFNYLETAPQSEVDAEALRIARTIDKGGTNWIRWNGVGDLIPGSVRVINAIARLRPDIAQWVVTRKVRECATLDDVASIKILFSLDETTPDTILQRAKELSGTFKVAAFRFAWTRSDANAVPAIVDIIFNEHIGRKHTAWQDERVCEATLPNHTHTDTCNTCRRCFA